MRRVFLTLLSLILLLAAAAGGIWYDYQRFLQQPLALSSGVLELKSGGSISSVAQQLQQRGAFSHPLEPYYLQAYARLEKLAPKLKVGEYALEPNLTPVALLSRIVNGKVIQYELTLVEGWTFAQVRAAVAARPKLRHELVDISDGELMARIGHAGVHPEGRFFPDTYHFPAGTRDIDFLKRAYSALHTRLEQAWAQRADNLPLQSAEQALILASLIEKETAQASERPEIAGVFIRRLQKGMRLQTDPAVIYGLGERYQGNLTRAHLEQDGPYNTYTRVGLPPTPIALVGEAALKAAVSPASGDSLFFVAKGDGSGGHVFSKTLEEHNLAVREYLKNLRGRNP